MAEGYVVSMLPIESPAPPPQSTAPQLLSNPAQPHPSRAPSSRRRGQPVTDRQAAQHRPAVANVQRLLPRACTGVSLGCSAHDHLGSVQPTPTNRPRLPSLHQEISEYSKYVSPTAAEARMRRELVGRLARVAKELWPKVEVRFLFGKQAGKGPRSFSVSVSASLPRHGNGGRCVDRCSSLAAYRQASFCRPGGHEVLETVLDPIPPSPFSPIRFAIIGSDVDVVLIGKWQHLPLHTLARALKSRGISKSMRVIAKARVSLANRPTFTCPCAFQPPPSSQIPIIKYKDAKCDIEVDVSFNVRDGPRNGARVRVSEGDEIRAHPHTRATNQTLLF